MVEWVALYFLDEPSSAGIFYVARIDKAQSPTNLFCTTSHQRIGMKGFDKKGEMDHLIWMKKTQKQLLKMKKYVIVPLFGK